VHSDDSQLQQIRHASAVWLGHASFYVVLDNGISFVTDPVMEDRCGPFALLGPKRITPYGCTAQQLAANADFVIISHSHYDHLSVPTLSELSQSVSQFFVPLGLKDYLTAYCQIGPQQVTELDWGEEICYHKVSYQLVLEIS
jgi:L-ascorbate metabolism protein UlaG (beta-lactamase superfamily)